MQLLWEIIGHLVLAGLLFTLTAMTVWYVREIAKRIKEIKDTAREIKELKQQNQSLKSDKR